MAYYYSYVIRHPSHLRERKSLISFVFSFLYYKHSHFFSFNLPFDLRLIDNNDYFNYTNRSYDYSFIQTSHLTVLICTEISSFSLSNDSFTSSLCNCLLQSVIYHVNMNKIKFKEKNELVLIACRKDKSNRKLSNVFALVFKCKKTRPYNSRECI